jgi:DNA replication protein DnaC
MNTETIRQQLQELRLKTAASELEATLASQKKTVPLEWLSILLSHEIDARREHAIRCRIHRAEFPEVTSLETFDWDSNPDINRRAIEDIGSSAPASNDSLNRSLSPGRRTPWISSLERSWLHGSGSWMTGVSCR